jgi:hypothetical protein
MSDYRLPFVKLLLCRQTNPVLCLICRQQSHFPHPVCTFCLLLLRQMSAVWLRRIDITLCEVDRAARRGEINTFKEDICLFYIQGVTGGMCHTSEGCSLC